MLDFDLMNIFNGFIRNYINFGLNKKSSKFEVIKKEIKYFVMLGQLLGYSVMHKGLNNDELTHLNKIEVIWKEYEGDIISQYSSKIEIFREVDMANDVLAIQNLVKRIEEEPSKSYIQVVETSSTTRINYLNNIINTSHLEIEEDVLLIYIIRDILNYKSYYNGYLFEKGVMTKQKIGICYTDALGDMKAVFKV